MPNFELASKVLNQLIQERPITKLRLSGKDTILKRYRIKKGLTGVEAAKKLGLSYRQYKRVETKDLNDIPIRVLFMLKLGVFENYSLDKEYIVSWLITEVNIT